MGWFVYSVILGRLVSCWGCVMYNEWMMNREVFWLWPVLKYCLVIRQEARNKARKTAVRITSHELGFELSTYWMRIIPVDAVLPRLVAVEKFCRLPEAYLDASSVLSDKIVQFYQNRCTLWRSWRVVQWYLVIKGQLYLTSTVWPTGTCPKP